MLLLYHQPFKTDETEASLLGSPLKILDVGYMFQQSLSLPRDMPEALRVFLTISQGL